MDKLLGLVAGFLVGGFARYYVSTGVSRLTGGGFPYGTLAVNLTGCFLLGLFDSMAEARFLLGPNSRLLLMTGFCGAYTTFSALMFETSKLVGDGQFARAAVNFFGSGLLGFLLLRLGVYLGAII